MAILSVGARAPEIDLNSFDDGHYHLGDAQLTLAIFFKTNCPTCQYAWPFFERIHRAYVSAGLRVWGISQNERDGTREFANNFGATFPHLLDEGWRVSIAYDPDFVPTAFLISRDGRIIERTQAWQRADYDTLGKTVARELQVTPRVLIKASEKVLPFKAG